MERLWVGVAWGGGVLERTSEVQIRKQEDARLE